DPSRTKKQTVVKALPQPSAAQKAATRPEQKTKPTELPPTRRSRRKFYLLLCLTGLGLGMGGVGLGWMFGLFSGRDIPTDAWTEFSPPESGVRVLMPGDPVAKRWSNFRLSLAPARTFWVLREREDKAFLLSWCERDNQATSSIPFPQVYKM